MPRLCLTWPLFIGPAHCWPDILVLCYSVINPLWRINEKCNQFACCFELAATKGTRSFAEMCAGANKDLSLFPVS